MRSLRSLVAGLDHWPLVDDAVEPLKSWKHVVLHEVLDDDAALVLSLGCRDSRLKPLNKFLGLSEETLELDPESIADHWGDMVVL